MHPPHGKHKEQCLPDLHKESGRPRTVGPWRRACAHVRLSSGKSHASVQPVQRWSAPCVSGPRSRGARTLSVVPSARRCSAAQTERPGAGPACGPGTAMTRAAPHPSTQAESVPMPHLERPSRCSRRSVWPPSGWAGACRCTRSCCSPWRDSSPGRRSAWRGRARTSAPSSPRRPGSKTCSAAGTAGSAPDHPHHRDLRPGGISGGPAARRPTNGDPRWRQSDSAPGRR